MNVFPKMLNNFCMVQELSDSLSVYSKPANPNPKSTCQNLSSLLMNMFDLNCSIHKKKKCKKKENNKIKKMQWPRIRFKMLLFLTYFYYACTVSYTTFLCAAMRCLSNSSHQNTGTNPSLMSNDWITSPVLVILCYHQSHPSTPIRSQSAARGFPLPPVYFKLS